MMKMSGCQTQFRSGRVIFITLLWISLAYTLLTTSFNTNRSRSRSRSRSDPDPDPDSDPDPCSGKYIYIHPLPPEFNDHILRDCRALIKWFDMCPYIPNLGFGPPLDNSRGILQSQGWYNTNQFLLEVIFRARISRYPCLTNTSSLAQAVFVPFYAGLDVGRNLWSANNSARDETSLSLAKWLHSRPEWDRMSGRDHFAVTGRISGDFRRFEDWGNLFMLLPETKNMTILGIESSGSLPANDFGIPYPTYFHPSSHVHVVRWQEALQASPRPNLFSFAGLPRPNAAKSVRSQVMSQCESSSRCALLDCDPGEHNKCDDPSSVIELFRSSSFCLQPKGDSYTRRSIFDSILSGCVPVFFHEASAYKQYRWHLPENYSSYSVFIPEREVLEGKVSIERELMGFSSEEIMCMRDEVIRLIPRIVYADPNSNMEMFEDAFDISVDRVLRRVETLRSE